jgi:sulfite exporter TauE/SafE
LQEKSEFEVSVFQCLYSVPSLGKCVLGVSSKNKPRALHKWAQSIHIGIHWGCCACVLLYYIIYSVFNANK